MKRKKSLSVIERNESILASLKDLKADHPLWGYRRCWAYLFYRQHIVVNKKRIYRLIKEQGLLVTKINRYKAKRKISRPKLKASYLNHVWGTDMIKIKIGAWGLVLSGHRPGLVQQENHRLLPLSLQSKGKD